jgi:phospholipid/cholesterol/gamma-HCH transport system substrate-binding protein
VSDRVHRADARAFVIGVVAVAAGLAVAYIGLAAQTGGRLPAKSYTEVVARFDDVGALKPKQKVVVAGIRVGQVSRIVYDAGSARVTLRLDGTRPVYRDASASIRTESALGRKYVSLDPGTPASGPLGSHVLGVDSTASTDDIDTVLSTFDAPARHGMSVGLTNLGGGLIGKGPGLNGFLGHSPSLLSDGRTVIQAVSAPESNLAGLIDQTERVASSFSGREQDIADLLDSSEAVFAAINVDDGKPLSETLERSPETLQSARRTLKALRPTVADAAVATKTLRPGVRDLAEATPNLRTFLRTARRPLDRVPAVAKDAEPAVVSLDAFAKDARPLVGRTSRLLEHSGPLLKTFRPYLPDAGHFFANNDLLSGNFGPDEHYFGIEMAMFGLYNASLPDPLYDADPYPGPGKAFDRQADQ